LAVPEDVVHALSNLIYNKLVSMLVRYIRITVMIIIMIVMTRFQSGD
jgi:hypothetical protein